jgi:hypothetical protein
MSTNLKYMPTFRARQQEMIVLKSFDFGNDMYPMIEIVKEFDRVQNTESTKTSFEVYAELIKYINAERVFLDLPFNMKVSGSTNKEVVKFLYGYSYDLTKRTDYLLNFNSLSKVVPVISSYLLRDAEINTISKQFHLLAESFNGICFRVSHQTYLQDIEEIRALARATDFLVLDLDGLSPYPTQPSIKPIINNFKQFTSCPKIVLRSVLNNEIQNVKLEHESVLYDADNSLLENFKDFGADAFGDYCGIKKDDISAGGAISPGFIYFDADQNQYWGFKGAVKELGEFATTIVPAVLASDATKRMKNSPEQYLDANNVGFATIEKIGKGEETGKSQAKFKKIAMEHYLACMRKIIQYDKYGFMSK